MPPLKSRRPLADAPPMRAHSGEIVTAFFGAACIVAAFLSDHAGYPLAWLLKVVGCGLVVYGLSGWWTGEPRQDKPQRQPRKL